MGILHEVSYQSVARQYYASKFNEFGATHRGADWNSIESQELRFTQLLKVHDYGHWEFTLIAKKAIT